MVLIYSLVERQVKTPRQVEKPFIVLWQVRQCTYVSSHAEHVLTIGCTAYHLIEQLTPVTTRHDDGRTPRLTQRVKHILDQQAQVLCLTP